MADPILNKLIEVVQTLAESRTPSASPSQHSENAPTKDEDAMKTLYPSTRGRPGLPQSYNPNTNYKPTKRRASTSSMPSSKRKNKEPIAAVCKPVLKDVILLPSPRVENVPKGQFREYLYIEGYALSGVTISEGMDENAVTEMLNNAFKGKLEMSPLPKFMVVRAIGNKIIEVKNGPFTGKFLKHISKQGPLYIRATANLCEEEDISKWVGSSKTDDDVSEEEDELMKSAFASIKTDDDDDDDGQRKEKLQVIINDDPDDDHCKPS